MKVVFLCGSLELGRDGVGDYSRRLASYLVRNGHIVSMVALNDRHISEDISGFQPEENVEIPVLRLSFTKSEKVRFNLAKEYIDLFNPDWLSLQFVPFSFHPKGLSLQLKSKLLELGQGRKWHIMFHELWVGMAQGSPMKLILWGQLQRLLIRSLLLTIKPAIIHTQTQIYQTYLTTIGVKAHLLPLFSNIPVLANKDELGNSDVSNQRHIFMVIFGSIHPGRPVEKLAQEVAQYSKEENIPISLLLIGRSNNEKERWITTWKSAGLNVESLGEMSTECISRVLSRSSVGISTTPSALAEKSGSIAAMLDHGLPVLCISEEWKPRGIKSPQIIPGVYQYVEGGFRSFIQRKKKIAATFSNAEAISHQFENELKRAV